MPLLGTPGKKYEKFAYVIGIKRRAKSVIIKNKSGDILYALGQKFLNIMEILIYDNVMFEAGSKIPIDAVNRLNILSVLGRVQYKKTPDDIADAISPIVDTIVAKEEERFVEFINTAGPLTYRIHSLKTIPGISEKLSQNIIMERDDRKFDSYADIEERASVRNIAKNISSRIKEEIIDDTKTNVFVKR